MSKEVNWQDAKSSRTEWNGIRQGMQVEKQVVTEAWPRAMWEARMNRDHGCRWVGGGVAR